MLKNSTLINHIGIIDFDLFFLGMLNISLHWKIKRCILVQLLKRCILKIYNANHLNLKIDMINVFYDISEIKL